MVGCEYIMNIPVGISNRHVHLTEEVWKKLFGDEEITARNYLNQPGQFASNMTVDVKVGDAIINHVRVVGPFRNYNQIEIDDTDAKILGVIPPRRQSGDLNDSLPITVIGPKGSVSLDKGLIMSDAHIHMDPETATKMHLVNKEVVDVFKNGVKLLNAKIKILDNSYIEMHIDKDEEVLYDLHQGDIVEFKKTL